jgi:Ankyrin repeat
MTRRALRMVWMAGTLGLLGGMPGAARADRPPAKGSIQYYAYEVDLAQVRIMLSQRPDLLESQPSYFGTPLHCAASMGRLPVVQYLISKGANVNATTQLQSSVLFLACESPRQDLARIPEEQVVAGCTRQSM